MKASRERRKLRRLEESGWVCSLGRKVQSLCSSGEKVRVDGAVKEDLKLLRGDIHDST